MKAHKILSLKLLTWLLNKIDFQIIPKPYFIEKS